MFKTNHVHRTWAGTFHSRPERYLQPKSLDEIRGAIIEAKAAGKTIMLTGSGHSPSHLTMTSQWLMNLDRLNQVVAISPDPSGSFTDVTVEAGMRIYELNEVLAKEGLALQSLGSISDQSIAGLISTGTHGSSAFHGLVSQQVVDLSIMTGSGEVVKCSAKDNADTFRAGMVSLGKLGIITEVTIRAVPVYTLETINEVVSFDRFVNELWDDIWTSKEFVRVWWFPYAKQVVLSRAEKSQKAPDENASSYFQNPIRRFLYQAALLFAVKLAPWLTPYIERFAFGLQYGYKDTYNKGEPVVFECVKGHNMDCLFSQFVNEWALPLSNGRRVMKQFDQIIDDAAAKGQFFVHSPFEVRIANTTHTGDTGALEKVPEYGAIPGNELRPLLDVTPELEFPSVPRGSRKVPESALTLYLNATMYRPFGLNCDVDKWYQQFETVVAANGGKPHWAKNFLGTNPLPAGTKASDGQMRGLSPVMEQWFGENLTQWKRVRAQNDPTGVFAGPPDNNWAKINGLI